MPTQGNREAGQRKRLLWDEESTPPDKPRLGRELNVL